MTVDAGNLSNVDISNVIDQNPQLLQSFFSELSQSVSGQGNGNDIVDLSMLGNGSNDEVAGQDGGADEDDDDVLTGMPTHTGNDKEEAE